MAIDDIQTKVFKYIGHPFTSGSVSLIEDDITDEITGDVRIKSVKGQTSLISTVKQYSVNVAATQYPDTQALDPNEAARVLVEFALFPFLGRKRSPREIPIAISRAIETDDRLTIRDISVDGDQVTIDLEARSLQLIYNGISDYSGNYFYG